MATTQRAYKTTPRTPRYPQKLSAFSNGMYLTEQVVPNGYCKVMANYDVDSTGSHIKPKQGRKLKQIVQPTHKGYLAGLTSNIILSDYVYLHKEKASEENAYNPDVIDTVDVVITDGGIGIVYDKASESFKYIYADEFFIDYKYETDVIDYAFDKPIKPYLKRNITVSNNNIYAMYSGSLIKCYLYKDGDDYKLSTITPVLKENNALEAASAGYNILLEQPYKFKDNSTGSWSIHGMLAYDIADTTYETPLLSPTTGQDIKIKVNYSYNPGTTMHYKVEILNTQSYEDTWETLIKSTTEKPKTIVGAPQGSTANDFVFTINAKYSQFALRVTIDTTPAFNGSEIFSGVAGFTCDSEILKRYKLAKPDFSKTKYLVNWFSYVGLYGVEGYLDTVFFTDIENPGYIPFPNNALVFDNTVLAVKQYLDYLLVITVDSIYIVTIGSNLMSSTQKKLLSNISITEIDAQNTVILNDQIFVKTTDQFFVFKPNSYTSDATDLKNYVISTAIDNLTKNFTSETINILNEVYKPVCQKLTKEYRNTIKIEDFDVTDLKSYTVNSDVHYVVRMFPKFTNNLTTLPYTGLTTDYDYFSNSSWDITDTTQRVSLGYLGWNDEGTEQVFKYTAGLDMHLIYDSVVRSWRLYLEPQGRPYYEYIWKYGDAEPDWTAWQGGLYLGNIDSQNPISYLFKDKINGNYSDIVIRPSLTNTDTSSFTSDYDFVVLEKTYESCTDNYELYPNMYASPFYDMYQYLDTGIVSIEDVYVKRFREVQFNIVNKEKTMIPFHVDFKLDGREWISATNYIANHITDINDPDYGLIYITPVEEDNFKVFSTTTFAENILTADHWSLDLSRFPNLTNVTVRFELRGKGRHASLQLLNDSLKRYALSDINWVYRTMNGR